MTAYVTFLLDLEAQTAEHKKGSLSFRPDPERQPQNAFMWKVTCDSDGVVAVRALKKQKLIVIASAKWTSTKIAEREQRGNEPTMFQWNSVEESIRIAQSRAEDRKGVEGPIQEPLSSAEREGLKPTTEPDFRSAVRAERQRERDRRMGKLSPGAKKAMFATLAGIALFVAFGVISMVSHQKKDPPLAAPTPVAAPEPPAPTPPKTPEEAVASADSLRAAVDAMRQDFEPTVTGDLPPGAELLANYRPRWSELEGAATTTIPRVEKDPAAERGGKLCATGEIEKITRREISGRVHYAGALKTAEGDRVVFLVAGSTGELVKRDQGTVCGVVTGTTQGDAALIGMFDLPDNRNPTVEKTE